MSPVMAGFKPDDGGKVGVLPPPATDEAVDPAGMLDVVGVAVVCPLDEEWKTP